MPPMHVLVLDKSNPNRQCDAQEEGRGQPELVVRVERHFRQQVREGDAEEDARGKGQGTTNDQVLGPSRELSQAEHKADRAQWAHQGESDVGDSAARFDQPPEAIKEVMERASSGL